MEGFGNFTAMIGNRFVTNLKGSFADMTPEKFIRIVIIVGTYMLMRPYLIKLGGKRQLKRYEEEAARAEAEAKARAKVKITPNDLRGLTKSPYDSDGESEDEDDIEEFTGPRWGERKKKQQKKLIKQLEKRLQETKEEQEDKDIEEFLIKE